VNVIPGLTVIEADDLWSSNLRSLRLEELVDASRTPDPWPLGLPAPTVAEAPWLPRACAVVAQVDDVAVAVVLRSVAQVADRARQLQSKVDGHPALAALAARRLRRVMLSPWFAGPGQDTTIAPPVKAALDSLLTTLDRARCTSSGTTPRATAAGDEGQAPRLSARELQVARFVSLGMTNKQIAIQLKLSPNTIKRHLARILRRLGLGKRSAVATWYAVRQPAGEPVSTADEPAVAGHRLTMRLAAHASADASRRAAFHP
jgi:DNA-binding CsgD family transcriptional regulator